MSDYTPLYFFIFLGLPVIMQYIDILRNVKDNNFKKTMWGRSPKSFIGFSKIGILLALLSGFYMVYYTVDELPKYEIYGYDYETRGKYYVYLSLCVLLFSSNFWYISMKYKWDRRITTASLIGTGIGSILLMSNIFSGHIENPDDKMKVAMVATSILTFQTVIMDACIWNYYHQ